MRKIFIPLLVILLTAIRTAQSPPGRVVVEHIRAPSLQPDEDDISMRRVTIYLPPDYEHSTKRYPVIYYLHGFTWNDSLQIAVDHFDQLLDKAIAAGRIQPVIVAIPNHYTAYRGSMYTNSSLTGHWADFTAYDVVEYMDQHYRTIRDRNSRGLAGHSMGGAEAIKLGMQYPEVFSSVYALSPGVLALAEGMGPTGEPFRRAQQIHTRKTLLTGYTELDANMVVAMGRTFSPNPQNPPFFADLPFTYQEDSLIIQYDILDAWKNQMPYYMIESHIEELQQLRALKFDWGRNDEHSTVPVTCRMFSKKLENHGIVHYAEEYIGTHSNKLWTEDGRALNDMFPFFNRYLEFK